MNKNTESLPAAHVDALAVKAAHASLPWYLDVWVRLFREKRSGSIAFVLVLLFLAAAAVATFVPDLIPYGQNENNVRERLQGPSREHWLGTDQFGRDVFSRVIHGARISVIVGFGATLIGVAAATLMGTLSGYFGGWFDTIFQRVVDVVMSVPNLILLLVLVSYVDPGLISITCVLGLSLGFRGSRTIRGSVLGLKAATYIEAARTIGASAPRIMFTHILPNIMPVVIVMITIDIGAVILAEASLSFLGFGIPPPNPSWGEMLSQKGRQFMYQAPWMALGPGVALTLTVYSWNMFGDALRDLLDPRLRGSGRQSFS